MDRVLIYSGEIEDPQKLRDQIEESFGQYCSVDVCTQQQELFARLEELACEAQKGREQKLVVRARSTVYSLETEDILYVESCYRNLMIVTKEQQIRVPMKLGEVQEALPDYFLRCHQSFLVNAREIVRFCQKKITLKNGIEIPVSRKRYAQAREAYRHFLER